MFKYCTQQIEHVIVKLTLQEIEVNSRKSQELQEQPCQPLHRGSTGSLPCPVKRATFQVAHAPLVPQVTELSEIKEKTPPHPGALRHKHVHS